MIPGKYRTNKSRTGLRPNMPMRKKLPKQGTDWCTLERSLAEMGQQDAGWRDLKTAVFVFNAGDDVLEVTKNAYGMYQSENALGAGSAFPSLERMEHDVVSIGLDLLHAPPGACGNMTSGGSESVFLALKTCRDEARAQNRDTHGGEVLIPRSGHPAFDKAAAYLDLKIVRVPVNDDYRADVAAMAERISPKTLMLVGSAPCFPYGIVDPIEALSEIAVDNGLWLHVDACVGGYFAPFAVMNGIELPRFDFSLPGVRSVSADLHKYGYAAKGASTIFHRTEDQREYQYFTCDQWPLGTMRTPSAAGTRAGGAIAAAWAVLHYLGEAGYREKTADVIECRERLTEAIEAIDELKVVGAPQLGLIAYTSDVIDIYAVAEQLGEKGWFNPLLDDPPAIHLMFSPEHLRVMDSYIRDLTDAVNLISRTGRTAKTAAARYN